MRTAIDQFRSQQKYKEATDLKEHDSDLEEVQLNPANRSTIEGLSAEDVREMIYSLPERERMVFVLFEWEGYQHYEIAQKLDCSERSSKRYLRQAKESLKKTLSQKQALKKVI